jgi:hypothetical protein
MGRLGKIANSVDTGVELGLFKLKLHGSSNQAWTAPPIPICASMGKQVAISMGE